MIDSTLGSCEKTDSDAAKLRAGEPRGLPALVCVALAELNRPKLNESQVNTPLDGFLPLGGNKILTTWIWTSNILQG